MTVACLRCRRSAARRVHCYQRRILHREKVTRNRGAVILRSVNRTAHRDSGPASLPALLAGEPVELHAERALFWPRGKTLFVADVHLGKSAAFRAGGVPVPRGATAADLARLARLISATGAERLTVLGDFLHAAAGRTVALDEAFLGWRAAHRALALTLVRGNHDEHAGDPPAAWGVEVVTEPHDAAPFLLCHQPPDDGEGPDLLGYALAGHVHPGVRISGIGGQSERLPCFVLGHSRAILPAFGRFTGLALHGWERERAVIAIAGEQLYAVPRQPRAEG